MKKYLLLSLFYLSSFSAFAQYTVSGGIEQPYVYKEDMAGGVQAVYLFNSLTGATIRYSSEAVSVKFYRYQTALAERDPVPSTDISESVSGGVTSYTVTNLIDSRGYWVEENGKAKPVIWIVDYMLHQAQLVSIEPMEDGDICENLKLLINKSDALFYYTASGGQRNIHRQYTISYNTLEWKEDNKEFEPRTKIISDVEIGTEWVVDAPLVNTVFTLSGDQFANHFNKPLSISSAQYQAVAVQGHIVANRQLRDAPNETGNIEGELGGSAPVQIKFEGYANKPIAQHYTWFVYNVRDMNNALARYTDEDIEYTFDVMGDYSVVLEVADRNSLCIYKDSVRFKVTESALDIPNYFSPGDSPGSNDEFRVMYKSLVSFKCTIFNRWGVKLYQWTDPAKGWDGKYKGNYVAPGVYFYVVEAKGADGVIYKRGGDINILRKK